MRTQRLLALGTFLTDLRARLSSLSQDQLTSLLLAHAERLPAGERAGFLDIFTATSGSSAAPTSEDLLDTVRTFAARVTAGEFDDSDGVDGWDYEDEWDDDPSDAWVPEAEALFAGASEVFLTGTPIEARTVYGLLLSAFSPTPSDELGYWEPLELGMVTGIDVREVLARYLRCVYETTPAPGRPVAMREASSRLPRTVVPIGLAQIAGTRTTALPDLAAFLPGWIEVLVEDPDWPEPNHRARLLADAAWHDRGLESLADLARRPGAHQGELHRIWIDALTEADRTSEAIDAARAALTLPGVEPDLRAGIADRLADLCLTAAELSGAVEARRVGWRARPSRDRLLALVEDARAAGVADDALAAEAARVQDVSREAGALPDRLGCEVLLLAGQIDAAVRAVEAAGPARWSLSNHPGPVVLPYLWAAATGLPAGGQLQAMFTAIDAWSDEYDHLRMLSELWAQDGDHRGSRRSTSPRPQRTPLTALLAETIAAERSPRSAALLEVAQVLTDARVQAVVSNKHRRSYPLVAVLIVAHAEALAVRSPANARDYVAGVRARYPRHVAFQSELDEAAKSSSIDIGARRRH